MKVLAILLLVFCCSCGVHCKYCRPGWVPYGDSCYGFSNEKLPWAEAQAVCAGFGAHLAVIETTGERSYLESQARSRGDRNYWIGATDMMYEGVFTWITTGQQVYSTSNWSSGQPDNGSGTEHCVEMRGRSANKWNDEQCTVREHFICEE